MEAGTVILQCNFEELMALRQGASMVLQSDAVQPCAVLAPPAERAQVEALVPALAGDVSIGTLSEQREIEAAVRTIVVCLRAEMDAAVVAAHPADEVAVACFFDYAHALVVLDRLEEMGDHMRALIEIVSGEPPSPALAASFAFPD
jgi:hypothetical protein